MKHHLSFLRFLFVLFILLAVIFSIGRIGLCASCDRAAAERWSEEKANEWYASQPWPVGCVYMPSYGGTPVEIWGKEYFNPDVVDSELALAEDLGFNAIRLFLCDVVWQEDPKGFMKRLEETVRLADKHGMRILMTFFTNGGTIKNPYTGPQPQPVPGVHNSVWMSSPGKDVVNNPEKWPIIERYLKQVMKRYKNDPRILAWCLYNEPEHSDGFDTISFIKEVYRWAREVNPSQPLTSPMCAMPDARSYNKPISDFICENSDIISFHCYDNIERCAQFVEYAQRYGRPVLCSEWMARTRGSDYPSILPLFKEKKIGSFSYGLVNGKQQCQYPWNAIEDGKPVPFPEEPEVWFHDLFRPDHTPYDETEISFIKEYLNLEAGFKNPPHESRPMALWHWMNGNVTKDGIKKDLQWMHDIGLSGFFLFDAAYSTPKVVDHLLPYMSEGWKDAFRYAVALADSLGLEVGIASSPGWSLTGGPWVSEDDAQKKLVWSETPVSGHFHGPLPLPEKTVPTGLFHAVPPQEGIVRDYLKEVRVLAVRQGTDPEVKDITESYKNGTLDWTAPEGEWTVYRFAYTLIGTVNGPAPPEATGLEVDKLDAGAVRRYWENYLGLYEKALGRRLGPGTISNIDIDSYESGKGTWTLRMEEEFEKRRGYSMALWLPALAGEKIGTDEERERFLFDWRQTLGELIAENHYDLATEIFHSHGIKRYSESHEERRSFMGDGMMVKRTADVPQGAFWVRFRAGVYATMPHMEADLRESSSVAHIYGQNICAAEAFTTNGRPGKWDGWWAYQCHPGKLKPVADAAMAEGLNRFVIHTSVHQPSEKFKPGLGLGPYGQWFNRFDTWASEARPWIDYISRSCFMLSQGRFVADIAYLYGEDTNPTARFSEERPAIPSGWNYDFVNGDALVNALEIKDGSIVSKSGASYRMLVIDSQIERMSDAVAGRIEAIREAGIPVCDLREGGNIGALLDREGISADVVNVPDSVAFVHRKLFDGEIYWIANICSRPRNMTLGLRDCVSGASGRKVLEPKVWKADRGTIEDVSYRVEDGRLFVDLCMERDDAVFIVLRGQAKKKFIRKETPVTEEIMSLSSWDVLFVPAIEPDRGADYHLDSLCAWNESRDPFLRFFSGTATYRASFRWSADPHATGAVLDLGQVFNMAHVFLNGHDLGLLWKEPYKIDVSDALVHGDNTLEIKIINSWGNRLIGDSALPVEERSAKTSWEFYFPNDPLPVSGLLGPVRISLSTGRR